MICCSPPTGVGLKRREGAAGEGLPPAEVIACCRRATARPTHAGWERSSIIINIHKIIINMIFRYYNYYGNNNSIIIIIILFCNMLCRCK
jgi:hypothetical protein